MKKSTKKFTGSIATLATVASIIAPSAAVLAAETSVEELVSYAEKTANFYDFNVAFGKVLALPKAEQASYLGRLAAVESKAKTADIQAVLKAMDDFGPNRDLTNFYKVFELVNKVTEQKNRLYLQNELNTWGHASVFTADVVVATDAIIKAWGTKSPVDIAAAEAAVVNVKLASNVAWCNEQLAQIKASMQVYAANVNAINAREIQVKYSRNVDEATAGDLANYVLTINGSKYGEGYAAPVSAVVSEVDVTDNVVTFKLVADATLWNGDKYSVDVKDGVLSEDLSGKVGRFGDVQHVFTDYSAPTLVSSSIDGDKLVLEFNEPVQPGFAVTVDGQSVAMDAPSADVLDYTVTSTAVLSASQLKVGTHNVVVYNVKDLVLSNGTWGNNAALINGSYTIAAGQVPYVKEVKAVDFNSLKVTFSETVNSERIVIKKGDTVFYDGANAAQINLPLEALTPAGAVTKLYNTGDTSVALSLEVTGYKDADSLIGAKYNTTLTLSRDAENPAVVGQYTNKVTEDAAANGVLLIPFDREQLTSLDASKVTVTDKNGIVRTAVVAIVDADGVGTDADALEIKVVKTGATYMTKSELNGMASFTVSIAAGAVKVKTDAVDVTSANYPTAGATTNSLLNVAQNTVVNANDSYGYNAVEAVQAVVIANNVVTVTYKEAMSANAATLANYTLDGVAMPAGTTINMSGDNKVVTITLPKETYTTDVQKKLFVSKAVTTKLGSYVVGNIATKDQYMSELLQLLDNVKPTLVKAEYVVADTTNPQPTTSVRLTFSENLAAVVNSADVAADFEVTVNGVKQTVTAVVDGAAGDKVVTLTLGTAVNPSQAATVKVVAGGTGSVVDVTDAAALANKLVTGTTVTTTGNVQ